MSNQDRYEHICKCENCDWHEHRLLVMSFQKAIEEKYTKLVEENNKFMREMLTEITHLNAAIIALQVKSGIWGLIGGIVPVAVLLLVEVFKK